MISEFEIASYRKVAKTMLINPEEITNFDKLCELLKKSDQSPENLGYIYEMMGLDGYDEWLTWMQKHRPGELP